MLSTCYELFNYVLSVVFYYSLLIVAELIFVMVDIYAKSYKNLLLLLPQMISWIILHFYFVLSDATGSYVYTNSFHPLILGNICFVGFVVLYGFSLNPITLLLELHISLPCF